MEIQEHKLIGTEVTQISGPQTTGGVRKVEDIDMLIIYGTGLGSAAYANKIYSSGKYSTHVLIDKDQRTFQFLDFNRMVRHIAKGEYAGKTDLYHTSIGIHLQNILGPLTKNGTRYLSKTRAAVNEAYQHTDNTYWDIYPEAQITKLVEVCKLLKSTYNIKYIVTQDEINPEVRTPGPAFPFARIKAEING